MEFSFHQNEFLTFTYKLLLLLLSAICLRTVKHKAKENKKKIKYKTLPEPDGTWPLIGHLRLLQQQNQLPHRALGALADKYGPAFGIRIGANRAFVVSNCEVAKECFTNKDMVFSSRPKNLVVQLISYAELSLGFAPYGQHWRDMKKMAMTQLLLSQSLEQRKDIPETEINSLLQDLYKKCVEHGGLVIFDLKERMWHLTMNIILRSVAGNRFEGANDDESRRCKKTFDDLSRLTGLFFISDAVPYLGWLDIVTGCVGEVKRTAKELDNFLGKWVEEHRENDKVTRKQDFMDVMKGALDDGTRSPEEIHNIIKATCFVSSTDHQERFTSKA